MTRWWWVRHGPTHEKAFVGWRDVPADLSDIAQISRLKRYLPTDAVVISSDLLRAHQTADAIADTRHRLSKTAALREFNFGAWDGLKFDAVAARDPVLSRRFWEEPGDIAAPEGESWNDVCARIAPVVQQISTAYAGQNIIAVAHIGVIMTQIQMATNSTPYQALGHNIDNLSVTDMSFDGAAWQIGTINHIA